MTFISQHDVSDLTAVVRNVTDIAVECVHDLSQVKDRKIVPAATLTIRAKVKDGKVGPSFCFFLPDIDTAEAYAAAINRCRAELELKRAPVTAKAVPSQHNHNWCPTNNPLIDRCSVCGEERA